jgi:CDP-diacylglycerol--glycerol-3-phosphate 3-phosphatidyltransferase
MPGWEILPRHMPAGLSDKIGRAVARAGISPNAISLIGFVGNVAAAVLIARNELLWAGMVYLFFSALDMVDGAVARATNQATPYGAVFDAVLDRASEAIVLGGCAWYFGERGEYVQASVTYAAVLGSVAVSYMRARAEVNGLTMREGFFRRQERVALLGIGLLTGWLAATIWILAALSHLTAIQRFWLIARGLRD